MAISPDLFTERQKNICEYLGVFGAALSLVCLIQHFIFAVPSWITYPMIPAYIFSIIAFLLLAFLKPVSFVLLIISAVFISIVEYLFIHFKAFSLIVLILFLYTIIVIVVLSTEQIPKLLRQKEKSKKAEDDFWEGKI